MTVDDNVAKSRLQAELDEEQSRIDRGKGTWPQPGYVTDESWARMHGRRDGLARALRIIETASAAPVEPAVPEGEAQPEGPVIVAGHDVRPRCVSCRKKWWPPEGVDAGEAPCPACRKRENIRAVPEGEDRTKHPPWATFDEDGEHIVVRNTPWRWPPEEQDKIAFLWRIQDRITAPWREQVKEWEDEAALWMRSAYSCAGERDAAEARVAELERERDEIRAAYIEDRNAAERERDEARRLWQEAECDHHEAHKDLEAMGENARCLARERDEARSERDHAREAHALRIGQLDAAEARGVERGRQEMHAELVADPPGAVAVLNPVWLARRESEAAARALEELRGDLVLVHDRYAASGMRDFAGRISECIAHAERHIATIRSRGTTGGTP